MNPQFLKQVELFRELGDSQLAGILMLGRVKEYPQGSIIFEESSAGDRLYIIYRGAVRISKMFDGASEEALTILRPGDFLGEMSFFDEERRSAQAIAHEDAELLEILNTDLRKHLEEHPEVALRFLWAFCRTLSQRVRATNEKFTTLFTISRVF